VAVIGPTVSVVVPCYTAVWFVAEALGSVFAQSFSDYEVIVVDDGSTDTERLEAVLLPHRARIRYIRQQNRGPAGARNTGILHGTGTYVAFLDSDDVWLPHFLSEHVALLDGDPSLDMVYGNPATFGAGLAGRGARPVRRRTPRVVDATFENLVRRRCNVHPTCVVARRGAPRAAGLFDERLRYSEDLDLWARLVHRGGRIGFCSRVLARRRVHASSLTVDVDRLIRGQLEMGRKLLGTLPTLTDAQRAALEEAIGDCEARLCLVAGAEHLLHGRFREASADLRLANGMLRSWRLGAVIAGLRVAPRQLRRVWLRLLERHPTAQRIRLRSLAGAEAADRRSARSHLVGDGIALGADDTW
jgi:hypothetical protein